MKRKICVYVYRYPNEWGPTILDNDQCDSLLRVAVEVGLCSEPTPGSHISPDIQASEDHAGWPYFLEALRKLGWNPHPGPPPAALRSTHFNLRKVVTYDERDIEEAEYLRIADTWGKGVLTSFYARSGQRWVGISTNVGRRSGLKWGQTYGSLDGWRNYFVNSEIKRGLEASGLDLSFHPLGWDKPELALGAYWEVDTPNLMPNCLLSVFTDEMGARHFNDGGCEPQELKFLRSEVESIGKFNAAWTREILGNPNEPRDGGRSLIVSQKFRETCRSLGLTDVRYIPVRIV